MKLLFELPEEIQKKIGDLPIRYCVPMDIDEKGVFIDGYLICTEEVLIIVDENLGYKDFKICEGEKYEARNQVGCGYLEGVFAGSSKIIARYSMEHSARYKSIARALNQLQEEGKAKIRSDEEESHCPRCGRIYQRGTKVCPGCTNTVDMYKKLWQVGKKQWKLFTLAFLLFWCLTAVRLINPWLYKQFINEYLSNPTEEIRPILVYVGAIGIISILTSVFTVLRGRIMVEAGSNLAQDLRDMVYEKIQALSIGYMGSQKTGDLMNRVTGDTTQIRNFIHNQAPQGINEILVLIGVVIILMVTNWRLALLVLIPAPVVTIFIRLTWKRVRLMYRKQRRQWDKANSLLQDIISGIRVVKAFGQEEDAIHQFQTASKKFADVSAANEKRWNTWFPMIHYVMGIGSFFILYFGGRLVFGGEMNLGELVQFSQYAGMIYGPLNFLSFFPRMIADIATATERIFEIIDRTPDILDQENAVSHPIEGEVTFQDVTFGYFSHEPVLENIQVQIQPGEMIGLVGHSGSGKTTFINLVMRFYDADEGEILIDGVPIKDMGQEDLHKQIGVVLQETFLFSGTILDNIRYSNPEASIEEVIQAAKIANAHDFIMRFPDGYDTRVGENGQRLSGGERQRIAIARAVLCNPKLLILDEATASLDTHTEQEIQEALGRVVKDRTTIAIAHRLSTLRNANRLFVFEKGKIVEIGTHKELMGQKGIYYKLVMAQRQITRLKNA